MNNMKLNIHLVTWNGSKYIPFLFDSLKKQTYKDFKLIILDNASSDDTVEKIKKELLDCSFEHELVVNKENKGFSGGHNQLYQSCVLGFTSYVLLLNQDMYLESDCLEKLVNFMESHSDVVAISPRLMRWDFVNKEFTDQIDTLGFKVLRNRRVIEKYAGKNWADIKPKMELSYRAEKIIGDGIAVEVFGVSGAIPLFRADAIKEVGLFDEAYGSYKEDVDLAYRLRSAGYKAYVVLDAVAYHDRSAPGLEKKGDLVAVENKKKQSELVRYNSYRNHLITLIKNEYWQNYLLDLAFIKWYELKKFVYFLLFDRKILGGLKEIYKMRKDLKNKRAEIIKKRKVSWREMRKWWN